MASCVAVLVLLLVVGAPVGFGLAGTGAVEQQEPLPLGTLTPLPGGDPQCLDGYQCSAFRVTCPDIQPLDGFFAVAQPTAAASAVVVFASGGQGTSWWGDVAPAEAMIADLRSDGFVVVQLRWKSAWLRAGSGQQSGSARLGCRPATAVKWVHDNHWAPLGLDPPVGACGFCISGSSGGASQVAYPLNHYGLETILDAVVPTSGPVHAALDKGCLRHPGDEPYWFNDSEARIIDHAYGYSDNGPCLRRDPSFEPFWDADSLDDSGDHVHPRTRVHFIFGENDNGTAPVHAQDYIAALEQADTPYLIEERVAAGHQVHGMEAGAEAIRDALQGQAVALCEQPDVICGTEGNDHIEVRGNDKTVYGMGGNDRITVEGSGNLISGGPGADSVTIVRGEANNAGGGGGPDTLTGSAQDDILKGGARNDLITAGRGNDVLRGGLGEDDLSGGRGRDLLVGSAGGDQLNGGSGDDVCKPGPGRDRVARC